MVVSIKRHSHPVLGGLVLTALVTPVVAPPAADVKSAEVATPVVAPAPESK